MKKANAAQKLLLNTMAHHLTKVPLIVKLTEDGHASLTKDSLTIAKNGKNERKSYRCAI